MGTWLSLALALVQLVLWFVKKSEEKKAIAESDARAIARAGELLDARIRRALGTGAAPTDGSTVPDPNDRASWSDDPRPDGP